jgi:hypothetical protein
MLPPGHVAGGYLTAKLVSLIFPVFVNPLFFILTSIFALIPDLDMFIAFYKNKRLTIKENEVSHRKFITHAPLLYLGIYLLWIFLFPDFNLAAHAFILGTWSHFILDSFSSREYGIKWLYPFFHKPYSFNLDTDIVINESDFLKYWFKFFIAYTKLFSFKLEIVLILIAIVALLTTNY